MRLTACVMIAAAVACTTATEPKLGEEFELRVGEHAAFADAGLWIAFIGVTQDSRCPLQAMCVWAGDAAVLVETAPYSDALSADSKTDTLHTNLDPRSLSLGLFELDLVRLAPYPQTPSSISPDEYVATFVIRES